MHCYPYPLINLMLLLNLPQDFTQWKPFYFELLKLMLVHYLSVYSQGFTRSAFLYVCLSTLVDVNEQ